MSAESWITLIVAFVVIYGGLALCIGIALGRRTPYEEEPATKTPRPEEERWG